VFEKYNILLHGNSKKDILTKEFLRKYIYYMKKQTPPTLTNKAIDYISKKWTSLRSEEKQKCDFPITVRTLETLIRLASAHAKLRMSKAISEEDAEVAYDMLSYALFNEGKNDNYKKEDDNENEQGMFTINPDSPKKKGPKTPTKKTPEKAKKQRNEDDTNFEVPKSVMGSKKKDKERSGGKQTEKDDTIDHLFSSNIRTGFVTEELKKIVFKEIYNQVYKLELKQMTLDDLWFFIQKREDKKINTKKELVEVLNALDHQGKILYSLSTKDITLI